ncbi:hypothetical protein ABZ312_11680 [Streptomyces sp. NPDC006207]
MSDLMFRAIAHSRHLDADGRRLFWLGFNAGRAAAADENTARELERLISEHPAQAAGYLEGLAAARAVA